MRIENSGRSFHDQAVQVGGPDGLGKGLAQAMQKIEDQRLLDLNLFVREFELAKTLSLLKPGEKPPRDTPDQQPKKNDWPHAPGLD